MYIITTVLRGGGTQNVSYIFQCVFEGGLEHVSLHFEGIFKTLPTKMTPGGRSGIKFYIIKGVPLKNVSYILVWSPLTSNLKGVVLYTPFRSIQPIIPVVTHCPAQTTITQGTWDNKNTCHQILPSFSPMACRHELWPANCTEFRAGHAFCGYKCGSCNVSTDFYGQYPLRSRRILCHCVRAHFEWTKSHIIEKRTSQNRSTQNHPISESCSWNCWDHLTWCPCETWHTSCIQEAKHILHQQTPP